MYIFGVNAGANQNIDIICPYNIDIDFVLDVLRLYKLKERFIFVIFDESGLFWISKTKPAKNIAAIKVFNPGSVGQNGNFKAIKLRVLNADNFKKFKIKGCNGDFSLLRLQNLGNSFWNKSLTLVRELELNPRCKLFEAPMYNLLTALLKGSDEELKSARSSIIDVFTYLKNNALLEGEPEEQKTKICDYIELILKIKISNFVEILRRPDESADNLDEASNAASNMQASAKSTSTSAALSGEAGQAAASNMQASAKSSKSKKSNKFQFDFISFADFINPANKDEMTELRKQLDDILATLRNSVVPDVLEEYKNAILKSTYSFGVFDALQSSTSKANSCKSLSKGDDAANQQNVDITSGIPSAGTADGSSVDDKNDSTKAQETDANTTSDTLESRVNKCVQKFQDCVKQAWNDQKDQKSQSTLSKKEQNAVRFISRRLRQNISFWAKSFCDFRYCHLWEQVKVLKERHPYFAYYPAPSLQNLARRLSDAFERWKRGRAGFPRYKSQHSRHLESGFSFYLTNQQVKVDWSKGIISLPKGMPAVCVKAGKLQSNLIRLGLIKHDSTNQLIENSDSERKLQNATLKFEDSELFVSLLYTVPAKEPVAPDNSGAVGIDSGVAISCAVSNGIFVSVREKLQILNSLIDKCNTKISGRTRNSNRCLPVQKYLSHLYARKKHLKSECCHKLAQDLCKHNKVIVFEDLNIRGMTRSAKGTKENPGKRVAQKSGLNRGILDNFWGLLRQQVCYYATQYKCLVVFVAPAYTSQTCPVCGHVDNDNRPSQAKFKCVKCGYENNADLNAAINIRNKGVSLFPPQYQALLRADNSGDLASLSLGVAKKFAI